MSSFLSKIFALAFGCSLVLPIRAQEMRAVRPFGIGVMAGPTSGITFKAMFEENVQTKRSQSIDLNLTTDLDDFLLGSAHITRNTPLQDSPMSIYVGPGLFFGVQGKEAFWGPSANIGAFFERTRYEIFLQIMPRVQIMPEIKGEFGASVGLRYQF